MSWQGLTASRAFRRVAHSGLSNRSVNTDVGNQSLRRPTIVFFRLEFGRSHHAVSLRLAADFKLHFFDEAKQLFKEMSFFRAGRRPEAGIIARNSLFVTGRNSNNASIMAGLSKRSFLGVP